WLTFEEIARLSRLFVQLGVRKIRLTGGEPLLRPNLDQLINQLAQIKGIDDLALTTNGSLLAQFSPLLKKAGLKRLTISLDSLDSRIFKYMSGQKGKLHDILAGIAQAEKDGFEKIRINVVIQKGVNDHNIFDLIEYFRNSRHIIRFIEYMDVGTCNHWQSQYVLPNEKIIEAIKEKYSLIPLSKNYYGEVAQRYRFADGTGEIGFISSISQPFCHSCTRARLSTDGKIYTCLFAKEGLDLKHILRSGGKDADLLTLMQNIWQKRVDQYSQLRQQKQHSNTPQTKVEMFHIGG
ncbi:MAG: GTP 3',8-cyclase MoaA, partial [Candidatus Omnitrophica bacterium]|nr:GTP 3',8-cyclase MoaA [Candidatus Omnitrophota bacterium]